MAGSWYRLIAFLAGLTICISDTSTQIEITQQDLEKLAKANNYLALNMLHELSSESSNIFFSPLSLSTAFGMLYYGVRGEAAEELRNVLGYENADIPERLVHETFHEYLTALLSHDNSEYVLNIANSILLSKELDVDPAYVRNVRNLYQASVKDVDFVEENQEVIDDVNNWVKDKTNGKIENLVDDLDASTSLIILNAIYFKGTWQTPFDPSVTIDKTFYNNGLESGAKEVPMMRMRAQFLYTYLNDAEVLEMPYKGDDISMVILLPTERDGLESLEKSLSLEKLSAIRNRLRETNIRVTLPKFKIEYTKDMASDFQSMGARDVFAPGADFSGITHQSNDIRVTDVIHKAVVEVNEEGSEAAAVTAIMGTRSGGLDTYFVADHPFLFTILDKRDDMILFVGHVTNL